MSSHDGWSRPRGHDGLDAPAPVFSHGRWWSRRFHRIACSLLAAGLLVIAASVSLGWTAVVEVGALLCVLGLAPVLVWVLHHCHRGWIRSNCCQQCTAYNSYVLQSRVLVDEYLTTKYVHQVSTTSGRIDRQAPGTPYGSGLYDRRDDVQTSTTTRVPVTVTERVYEEIFACRRCGRRNVRRRTQQM